VRSQTKLWFVIEYPEDIKRKFEHASHCREVRSPTLGKWSKAANVNLRLELQERLTRTHFFF
jgi:hypothetical protein